jgi:hypothetical protein
MSPGSILVGTSGYSFPDWVGPFYPPGMKSSDFLAFYGAALQRRRGELDVLPGAAPARARHDAEEDPARLPLRRQAQPGDDARELERSQPVSATSTRSSSRSRPRGSTTRCSLSFRGASATPRRTSTTCAGCATTSRASRCSPSSATLVGHTAARRRSHGARRRLLRGRRAQARGPDAADHAAHLGGRLRALPRSQHGRVVGRSGRCATTTTTKRTS